MCHRAEGMAPMSLSNFSEVRPWVRSIKLKVQDRSMPPWYVDKTVGIQQFANDRSLSDHEIDLIAKWVDAGAPQGNPRDLPAAKAWPTEDVWEFAAYFGRPPDLVVKSPDYTMPAVSQDRWWEVRGTPTILRGSLGRRDRDSPGEALAESRASRDDDVVPAGDGRNARFPPFGAQRQGRPVRAVPERQERGPGLAARSDAVRRGVFRVGGGQERRALRRARRGPVPARRLGARLGHPHERVG